MKSVTKQQLGTIKSWQNDKGFGFINCDQGSSVFFHISEYRPPNSPIIGERVVFKLGEDKQGRIQARRVQNADFVTRKRMQHQQRLKRKAQIKAQQQEFASRQSLKLMIAGLFFATLAGLAFFVLIPWSLVLWYLALTVITFLLYAKDKAAAKNGQWRTKESTLHTLSILGGWVGAMLAQAYLRHKSKKMAFRVVYLATVVIHLVVLVSYIVFHY